MMRTSRVRATLLAAVLALASATGSAAGALAAQPASGALSLVSPASAALDDPSRLVLSTVGNAPVEGVVEARNTGADPLHVDAVTVGGRDAGQVQLAAGQTTSFDIAPGGVAAVRVRLVPSAGAREIAATLTVSSSAGPASVDVAGLNAAAVGGAGEPTLAQVARALGYSSDVIGTESAYLGSTRAPRGQEVLSGYWRTADPSKPVTLAPVARYVALNSACPCDRTGFAGRDFVKRPLFSFGADASASVPGAANQRLLPQASGTSSFSTAEPFWLYGNGGNASDDGLNGGVHVMRFFPLVRADGVKVPDAWLVGFDIGVTNKNFDYQDDVFILRNAQPELPGALSPGSASLGLSFSSPARGTVADAAGNGTGFTGVQPSQAAQAYDPSALSLDTDAGVLAMSSRRGTNTGTANTQVNALSTTFDASRTVTTSTVRLRGPFTSINTDGGDEAGVWFGPDADNFLKVTVASIDGAPQVHVYREMVSVSPYQKVRGVPVAAVPLPPGAQVVDLKITTVNTTGAVSASYRVDPADASAPFTTLDSSYPADVMRWLSRRATSGVLVGQNAGGARVQAQVDAFAVRRS